MSDATIRQYHTSDLDRCRALWIELTQRHRDIYNDPSIGGNTPGLYFDKHLARVGPERLWVAEHEGEVVGLFGLIVDEREAEVEPIVVATTHRDKGIGRALLNRMVEEARELGVRYLSVKPVARNIEAISFYYDFGFRTLGEIEMFMDLGAPAPGAWKPGPELFEHSFRY
jgi:ribosomal protein S18 acetylase RimI-like enzyme